MRNCLEILGKFLKLFGKVLEFLEFFFIYFFENFREFFRRIFGGISLAEFFWRNFFGGILWEEFFVYIGIDLFVKIWVFVKILSQWRRGGGGQEFRSLEVRRQAHCT